MMALLVPVIVAEPGADAKRIAWRAAQEHAHKHPAGDALIPPVVQVVWRRIPTRVGSQCLSGRHLPGLGSPLHTARAMHPGAQPTWLLIHLHRMQ
jgi:hypothetical protein